MDDDRCSVFGWLPSAILATVARVYVRNWRGDTQDDGERKKEPALVLYIIKPEKYRDTKSRV